MKIGVDARLLSRPLTGIGRYTLEMCRALLKTKTNTPNISLYLYSPTSIPHKVSSILAGAHIRTGNFNNAILRQLWGSLYLPLWAKQDSIDVFWGPSHRLPQRLPKTAARVVTIHDLVWKYASETMRPISRLRESIQMPYALHTADAVVTDSQATASALRNEFSINQDKLSVVTLSARLPSSTPSPKSLEHLGINRPYFLFVGTLEPRKNLIRLLTAYSQLPESILNQAMLVIAGGPGWGSIDLPNVVARLKIADHVRSLGYVDENTLAALYKNALFLAMPSLYEGFGLPLLEAMVYGTPVLTANNSSMPEVAGDAGLFVDALDIKSIHDGLSQMIIDDALREKLAGQAILNTLRFSWDESAKQLISVFKKAIATRQL